MGPLEEPRDYMSGASQSGSVQDRTSGNSGFGFSGFIPGVVSGLFNWLTTERSMAENRRNMATQRQWQLEDWRRTTEYNSPAATMARLRSAGLNPDLVAGNGQTNAGMPSQGSVPSAPSAHPMDVSGLVAGVQARLQRKMTESTIRLQQAQAADLEASARQRDADTDLKGWQSYFVQNQSNTEYQKGLSLALDNFSKGYVPIRYSDGDGGVFYDEKEFGRIFYDQLDEAHNIIKQVSDEYDIRSYDLKYLRRMFEAMCQHDEAMFTTEANRLRSHSSVEKFLADNSWAQFLDYFVDKLSDVSRGVVSAYFQMRRFNR